LLNLIVSIFQLQNKNIIEVQKIINIAFCLLSAQELDVLFNIYIDIYINIKINIIERIVVFLQQSRYFC